MTIDEYREALDRLTDEQFATFRSDFGGKPTDTRDDYVRSFVDNPSHERRLCHLLGLKTEEEKIIESAHSSAQAAVKSADSAHWSMIWAALGVVVAVAALVVALL